MANAHSWRELAMVFEGRAGALAPAWREGTKEATTILWKQARANMNADIYAHPPDTVKAYTVETRIGAATSKTGGIKRGYSMKKHFGKWIIARAFIAPKGKGRRGGRGYKWTQTGNLLREERMKVLDSYRGLVRNAARYAHARHNLAATGDDVIPPPPKKKRKSWRVAPWRARAIVETREQRLDAYRTHLMAALKRRAA